MGWTDEELDLLQDMYGPLPPKEVYRYAMSIWRAEMRELAHIAPTGDHAYYVR
jgi:hypothetical protein